MGTLLDTLATVHSARAEEYRPSADDAFAPTGEDLAWWDSECGHAEYEPADDLEWLAEEADMLEAGPGPLGAGEVAAAAVRESAGHMERAGVRSAAAFGGVGHPYEALRPRGGEARTPLALELDSLAAWYSHLDTAAGDLAAAAVQCWANLAQLHGSADAAAFSRDDAEYELWLESQSAKADEERARRERTEEELERWGRVTR